MGLCGSVMAVPLLSERTHGCSLALHRQVVLFR